jgi:kumamolisin
MLDLCVVGAVAPGAKIAVYFTEFTEQGWVDAINEAVADTANRPSVISISYGNPEDDAQRGLWTAMAVKQVNLAFQAAAAQGKTICCASGDDGAADEPASTNVHADFPASSPYVLACGGTRLESDGHTIRSEKVWNDLAQNHGATGGGVSRLFDPPAWQSSANVPPCADGSGHRGRGVPDVAALADPETPFVIADNTRKLVGVGGTSAAAPMWSALVARINQGLGTPAGYLNPVLYTKVPKTALHDITSGNNGAYKARQGWDACTGWGSPDGAKLLAALSGKPV